MQKNSWVLFLFFFLCYSLQTQNLVKGILVDSDSENKRQGVTVRLKKMPFSTRSKTAGKFLFHNIPNGSSLLCMQMKVYENQNSPTQCTGDA